ncbi:MAG: Tyrosine phenol-lyase [Dehalococcoidia bacterium]|nr:Tyrosine phenol-lyase [Chloroflexota bacterium]
MKKGQVMAEPFRIKVVEPIRLISGEERERKIKEAGYNVFGLASDDVYIDLLTDSGTSAMSDNQWAGIMLGDESYAGCRGFSHLEEAVHDVLGFNYVVPAHQGRAAERLLFQAVVKNGDIIPFNMPFDTTDACIRSLAGKPVSCVADVAYEPQAVDPFKGNIDLEKLRALITEVGAQRIPFIMLTITNNAGGGQPVAMSNLKEVKEVATEYNIPVFIDAARCAENAYFIQQREDGYQNKALAEIIREQFTYSDGCTFSCKKDPMANIGGLIGLNNEELYHKILPLLIAQEGFITYGGLAGRDLEAVARGLREMTDDDLIANRIRQVEYLGELLADSGIQIVQPVGGHAVFVDVAAFLPHIPQSHFPADALAVELYLESGVRAVGLGALALSTPNERTGEAVFPRMELLRLAIPRRVYTDRHMDVVAEGLKRVYERRNQIRGLRIVHAPPVLRHFLARLEPV